ncbi:unnamed protein product [Lactuca saligna]|uniref:Uncharacterized protein n=1 Tax=Lactuca saligna TaxID=75948 RepID=A0AA35ZGI4_LACSI|nr:unnamed protein product [Lactuca saligna]
MHGMPTFFSPGQLEDMLLLLLEIEKMMPLLYMRLISKELKLQKKAVTSKEQMMPTFIQFVLSPLMQSGYDVAIMKVCHSGCLFHISDKELLYLFRLGLKKWLPEMSSEEEEEETRPQL